MREQIRCKECALLQLIPDSCAKKRINRRIGSLRHFCRLAAAALAVTDRLLYGRKACRLSGNHLMQRQYRVLTELPFAPLDRCNAWPIQPGIPAAVIACDLDLTGNGDPTLHQGFTERCCHRIACADDSFRHRDTAFRDPASDLRRNSFPEVTVENPVVPEGKAGLQHRLTVSGDPFFGCLIALGTGYAVDRSASVLPDQMLCQAVYTFLLTRLYAVKRKKIIVCNKAGNIGLHELPPDCFAHGRIAESLCGKKNAVQPLYCGQ